MIDQSTVNRIIEQNNIVDVISSYLKLKKQGTNYLTLCPFHDEKTPSFSVSEPKQLFKCFGCGKGGNVATFVSEYEKIPFFEALLKLAKRVNITVQKSNNAYTKSSKYDFIEKVYALANDYYRSNLKKYGKNATEYLNQRGISDEIIEKFEIGLALDSFSGLKNFFNKNDINDKLLLNTGLIRSKNNKSYDFFHGRIMFPIHSSTGKVIAFGARIYQSSQQQMKYINSPSSIIFNKSKELFGLDKAKFEISKKDYVIVCEGYLDVIKMHEYRLANCVAPLGTALTTEHLRSLKRYTSNFVLAYDSDPAGVKATLSAGEKIIPFGCNLRVLKLPQGDDPDSFLDRNGLKTMQKMIDNAESFIDFVADEKCLKMSNPEKTNFLIDIAKQINDSIFREFFANSIHEKFGIRKEAVLKKIDSEVEKDVVIHSVNIHKNKDLSEKKILAFILNDNFFEKKFAKELNSDYFFSDDCRYLYRTLEKIKFNQQMSTAVLMNEFHNDQRLVDLLAELAVEGLQGNCDIESEICGLRLRKYEHDLTQLMDKLKKGESTDDILIKISELKNKINKISKKTVRKIFV